MTSFTLNFTTDKIIHIGRKSEEWISWVLREQTDCGRAQGGDPGWGKCFVFVQVWVTHLSSVSKKSLRIYISFHVDFTPKGKKSMSKNRAPVNDLTKEKCTVSVISSETYPKIK